ncbi:glycosyl transferase family 1 [Sphingobium yanoikuyae]|uniref:Glycosyl transferase family 1 n=1 Tax=Sphingobium yanoikuyae TaxID=13690 RepID=A0A177JBL6_SPHYA|nr:glycosyl transferase family 1 [Sphingobium yanoikuyae]
MSRPNHLRIALDGFNFSMPKGTGVANYGFTLASMLRQMGHEVEGIFGIDVGRDPAIRETMLYDAMGREKVEHRKQRRARVRQEKMRSLLGVRMHEVPVSTLTEKTSLAERVPVFDKMWSGAHLFEAAQWHFRYFGKFLKISVDNPPDIMHWTYPIPVSMKGAKNIYTIHDIVPLKMPYTTLDDKNFYFKLVRECMRSADAICTVSETSRNDIIDRFLVNEAAVINTFQSSPVPPMLADADSAEDAHMIRQLFSLEPQDYFLFFGAVDPKKNLARVVEAYAISNARSPLVLVTARNWGMSGSANSGGQLELHGHIVSDDRIKQLDYLPRTLLFRLIRNAKAVLLPSLYEGFGLPALEAIQVGTPVVGSTTGSLPEVIGDAGLLVDPYNVQDIRAAIEKIDADAALRANLKAAGVIQARKFSDQPYQARLQALYASVL